MVITRNSIWQGWRNSSLVNFTIIGIWARGSESNYEPLSYELQPAGSAEVITVLREKMVEMIEKKLLIRVS